MLLDVNVLVALAWDSHVHHVEARRWFGRSAADGWATCSVTESGFVRVSSNPKALSTPISVNDAVAVLAGMRSAPGHAFLADDVSLTEPDVVLPVRSRDVTDAHLLALARRHRTRLVTFDADLHRSADGHDVHLLTR